MLPDVQIGTRRKRSTVTALQLLTDRIQIIWPSRKKQIASDAQRAMPGHLFWPCFLPSPYNEKQGLPRAAGIIMDLGGLRRSLGEGEVSP